MILLAMLAVAAAHAPVIADRPELSSFPELQEPQPGEKKVRRHKTHEGADSKAPHHHHHHEKKVETEVAKKSDGAAPSNNNGGGSLYVYVPVVIILAVIGYYCFCSGGDEGGKQDGKPAPGPDDMKSAKLLYVKLKFNWTENPDVKSLDDLKGMLGDGGVTGEWAKVPGLRHKYFIWHEETMTCSGVYVFYDEASLNKYMESDLFKAQGTYPHVTSVVAEVKDVMPGTELSIEKTPWCGWQKNAPPTREEVEKAKMLIVYITMDYNTGNPPASATDLYYVMEAPKNCGCGLAVCKTYGKQEGKGYPGLFGSLKGLRGKYFAYDATIDHCYGFYTFLDEASLKEYMASELFLKQGEPPHIKELTYTVHDVLPGTERSMDLGSWKGR